MRLADFTDNPMEAWRYSERFCNSGSPSGFTQVNRPPIPYRPEDEGFAIMGFPAVIEEGFGLGPKVGWLHPVFNRLSERRMDVTATASGRTVWPIGSNYFLKLSYPGFLGRVRREITPERARTGLAMTQYLGKRLPEGIGILREVGFQSVLVNGVHHCCVAREVTPWPTHSRYMIPCFALFDKDSQKPEDPTLGDQIRTLHSNALLDIVKALIGAFASLLRLPEDTGVLPEFNAQNIVIGFDVHWRFQQVVFRDLMRCEWFSVNAPPSAATYHRHWGYEPELCRQRISLAFDFKLSQYVLTPLLKLHGSGWNSVRRFARDILDPSWFPKQYWCTLQPILLAPGETPLVKHFSSPQFR